MLGRIKKSFVRFDKKLLGSLYVTFIRPFLEFAVPVWSPNLKGDCEVLERVQHRATKLVPSVRNHNYETRLKLLNLTTLTERRRRGDMIQVFKIFKNMEKFKLIESFKPYENNLRGHALKYHKETTFHS